MNEVKGKCDVQHRSSSRCNGNGSTSSAEFNGKRLNELLRARSRKRYAYDEQKSHVAHELRCGNTIRKREPEAVNNNQRVGADDSNVTSFTQSSTFPQIFSPESRSKFEFRNFAQCAQQQCQKMNDAWKQRGAENPHSQSALEVLASYRHISALSSTSVSEFSSTEENQEENDGNQFSKIFAFENLAKGTISVSESRPHDDKDSLSSLENSCDCSEKQQHVVQDEEGLMSSRIGDENARANCQGHHVSSTYLNDLGELVLLWKNDQFSSDHGESNAYVREIPQDQKYLEQKLAFHVKTLSNLHEDKEESSFEFEGDQVDDIAESVTRGKIILRRSRSRAIICLFKRLILAILASLAVLIALYLVMIDSEKSRILIFWIYNLPSGLLGSLSRILVAVLREYHLTIWKASKASNKVIATRILSQTHKVVWIHDRIGQHRIATIQNIFHWIGIQSILLPKPLPSSVWENFATLSLHTECSISEKMLLHRTQSNCSPFLSEAQSGLNSTLRKSIIHSEIHVSQIKSGCEQSRVSSSLSPNSTIKKVGSKSAASFDDKSGERSNSHSDSDVSNTFHVHDEKNFIKSRVPAVSNQRDFLTKRNSTVAFFKPSLSQDDEPLNNNFRCNFNAAVALAERSKYPTQSATSATSRSLTNTETVDNGQKMRFLPVGYPEKQHDEEEVVYKMPPSWLNVPISAKQEPIHSFYAGRELLFSTHGAFSKYFDVEKSISDRVCYSDGSQHSCTPADCQGILVETKEETFRRRKQGKWDVSPALFVKKPANVVQSLAQRFLLKQRSPTSRPWWHNVNDELMDHYRQLDGDDVINFVMALN